MSPSSKSGLLRQILGQIKNISENGGKSLAVFDLDSTLFDVSPRLQRILLDFAENPENQKKFPESVQVLKTIQTQRSDWGIKQSLIRSGLDNHSTEFHQAVRQFWIESFFSGRYLKYDLPSDGAVDFVNQVHEAKCEIVYLSGRDQPGMEKDTRQVLQSWKFPLDDQASRLVLKPQKGMDDAKFKRDWFLEIPDDVYTRIWFFENEPMNVNLIRQHLPNIEIVFFESTHAGKAEPPSDLPKILHFLLDED
jgi:hypothetical protein